MTNGESPKKKSKHKLLFYACLLLAVSIAVLYLLDKIIPERVGGYFTSEPEYRDTTSGDNPVWKEEAKPEEESVKREIPPKRHEEDIPENAKPKLKTIQEFAQAFSLSYHDWVIGEWSYNIERGKGKKIAKSIFSREELKDWNLDMLGERNEGRLKKGFHEFDLKEEEEEKEADGKKENPADGLKPDTEFKENPGAEGQPEAQTSLTPAIPNLPEETKEKPRKKPKPLPLDPFSYNVKRFMPGLSDDGSFLDYEGIDFKSVVSGRPDFKEEKVMRPEMFKKQFLSMGNGGSMVYEVTGGEILDQDGPDFIIYGDSAFSNGIKTAKVEVAEDDNPSSYVEFPCDSVNPPFRGCAGVHIVDTGKVDDLILIGGDYFDLAKIGQKRARFIRITDTADNKNSSSLPGTDGFNIDSISLVHAYKK